MQEDPFIAQQRLAELYREKGDEELLELAEDFTDLTEMAQQALRDEMKLRRLHDPAAPRARGTRQAPAVAADPGNPAAIHWEPGRRRFDPLPSDPGSNVSLEYTWKTHLCDCETREQAWQLAEALRRAGIESWIEAPQTSMQYGAFELVYPRIVVAADQLEDAREIAAQPIPQDIVDQSRQLSQPAQEYESPRCPGCGASDPVQLGEDEIEDEDSPEEKAKRETPKQDAPACNRWKCEVCEREWTDAEESSAEIKN
jgi:hypothetical protein